MTAPLRVLVVSDVSPLTVASGGERVLWELASRLARAGHAVRILARAPAGGAPAEIEREGVRLRHFPVDRRSRLRVLRSSILEARRAVHRALAEAEADVLHLYQPLSASGVLGSAAGRRIPSLYTFLSPAPLEYRSRTSGGRMGLADALGVTLLWRLEGRCLRRATAIHILSQVTAELLWKLYRLPSDPLVTIPGGADTDRFQPAANREAVRRALGLPAVRPVAFTLRNLEPRMGVDALLRAMALLVRRAPEVLLLVGGEGPLRGELEALAAALGLADRVRFLGFVPEAELSRYYQAADLFVLPSRELEGFGLVTVEALACGTPVVGTPVGATPELLEELDPALLFPDTSPEAMATHLARFFERLAGDPVWGQGLREACRLRAKTHYSWTLSASRLEETLRQLAERRAAPLPPAAPCPACGEPLGVPDLAYRGARYVRCPRCRTSAAARLPSPARLRRVYEVEYPSHLEPQAGGTPRAEVFTAVLDRLGALRQPGRLIDVGCGGGDLLATARERGWRGVGLDFAYPVCAIARRARWLPVVQAESAALPVREGCLDALLLVNVLDHGLDPFGALREAHRVLAPGGHLAIRVPNATFHRLCARLLASLGPFARWRGWDRVPILHLYAFTPTGLRLLVERAGFHVLEVRNSPLATPAGPLPNRPAVPGWVRGVIGGVGRGVAWLSGGRWRLAPSIELYARKPRPSSPLGPPEGRDVARKPKAVRSTAGPSRPGDAVNGDGGAGGPA